VDAVCAGDQGSWWHHRLSRRRHRGAGLSSSPGSAGRVRRHAAGQAGQARAALENLKRGLEAAGAKFADVVTADSFVTDLTDQDALNRVWGEYFHDTKPATTTVQVVRLATDPRCLIEINAIAVVD
jgi:enamine deaminase RidA (YjgF/YER057c/UK114 family)